MVQIESVKNGKHINISANYLSIGLFNVYEAEEFCEQLEADLNSIKQKIEEIKTEYDSFLD